MCFSESGLWSETWCRIRVLVTRRSASSKAATPKQPAEKNVAGNATWPVPRPESRAHRILRFRNVRNRLRGNGIIVENFIATASVAHLPEILCAVELGWRNLRRVPPDRGAIPAWQVAWRSGDHPVGDKGIDNFGRSTEAEVSESAVIHFRGMTAQAGDC